MMTSLFLRLHFSKHSSVGRRKLFLPAGVEILSPENYDDLWATESSAMSMTSRAFQGTPLAGMNGSARGFVMECVARRCDEKFGPTRDPDKFHGRVTRDYDWLRSDGSRIEAKHAKFIYIERERT